MEAIGVPLLILLIAMLAALAVASITLYRRVKSSSSDKVGRRVSAREVRAERGEVAVPPPTKNDQATEPARPSPREESGRPSEEESSAKEKTETVARENERVKAESTADRKHDDAEAITPEVAKRPTRVQPIDRGGRPRVPTIGPESKEQEPTETKRRALRPEIVCWKEGWSWDVGVEVPEELLLVASSDLTVFQDESPLLQHASFCERYRVKRMQGKVKVCPSKDGTPIELDLGGEQKNFVLFKLSGQHENRGRRVRQATFGSYLVVVPHHWERDEKVSGPPRVAPEPVSIEGYRAHFFYLSREGGGKIAFVTPESEQIEIDSGISSFDLVGTRLSDASEEVGPLFGVNPPQIRSLYEQGWRNVGTVVVGEEGSGKKRWRAQFSPSLDRVEQDLPAELVQRGGGWYFLRIYDANADLVESMDFRFISPLREITVSGHPFLPGSGGHTIVHIDFFHEPGCVVRLAEDSTGSVQTRHEDQETRAIIPADPACDETHWIVGPLKGPHVRITVPVERVWWTIAVEETAEAPTHWTDKVLTIPRSLFVAFSKEAIWLRFPRPRWIDMVNVGFDRFKSRPYRVEVGKRELLIPLRDFGDCVEIDDRQQEYFLKVWLDSKDGGCSEGIIAVVPAEKPLVRKEPSKVGFDLAQIRTPRLATLLTRTRRAARGPLHSLIKEVYAKRPKRRCRHSMKEDDFKKTALCIVALSLELFGARSPIPGLRKRSIERALRAREIFPETMKRVRERYETLRHKN